MLFKSYLIMEKSVELIKLISEFGVLIVIAGLYLYERFMSDRDSVKLLGDLKILLEDVKKKEFEKTRTNLTLYEFRDAVDLYLSSQKYELIMECDSIININHIHDDEEETRERVLKMVKRVHARHKSFIDNFLYGGREISSLLDSQDFIQRKADICSEWILGDNHHSTSLFRNLDSYFETFLLELE